MPCCDSLLSCTSITLASMITWRSTLICMVRSSRSTVRSSRGMPRTSTVPVIWLTFTARPSRQPSTPRRRSPSWASPAYDTSARLEPPPELEPPAPWPPARTAAWSLGIRQPMIVRSESSISPHMSDLDTVLNALAWLEL
jgi:hypothetical protein